MSKKVKLLEKLKNGTISGDEAKTLLGKCGFARADKKGSSHHTYSDGNRKITVLGSRKDLKRYQIEELQNLLSAEMAEEKEETENEGE